jgi:hypothetical protein
MIKYTWLQFEAEDKLNASKMFIGLPIFPNNPSVYLEIGGGFTKRQIEKAIKDFGARIIERKNEQS